MTTKYNFDSKAYFICIFSGLVIFLIASAIKGHDFGFVVSNQIVNTVLFYMAITHLFYARIKVCFKPNLYQLVIYGAIYGYISSLFSFLYTEAFFFTIPLSFLGLEKMTRFFYLLLNRGEIQEFFSGIFLFPVISMSWLYGVLVGLLIWFFQRIEGLMKN